MHHIKLELKRFVLRPSFLISLVAVSLLILLIMFVQHPNREIETFQINYGLTLQLFILPLFILLLGSIYVSEDIETKWVHLLHIYSFTPSKYVLIKWLSIFIGFMIFLIVSLLIFVIATGFHSMLAFGLVMLMLVFYSAFSILIGSFSKNRIQAIGLSLLLWSLNTLLAPLFVVFLSGFLNNASLRAVMIGEMFINPTSLTRLYYYFFSDSLDMLGPGFFDFSRFLETPLGAAVLITVSLIVIIVPIALSILRISREVRRIS